MSWGAYEVNLTASVAALLFALIWLATYRRGRRGYMLLMAAGWAGLCCYWGMIAVSAGAAPLVSRAVIASVLREVLLVSVALLATGKLAMLRLAWKLQGHR